jgi:hypothetical protein
MIFILAGQCLDILTALHKQIPPGQNNARNLRTAVRAATGIPAL